MKASPEVISQKKIYNSVENIPVEYYKWGQAPDHFKIDAPHRHEFSELLFFIRGGGNHELSFHNYTIKDFSIHYIPKSEVHFLSRDFCSDGFTIAFDSHYLEHNNTHRFVNPFKYEGYVLNLNQNAFEHVLSITKILKHQIFSENGYYKNKCFLTSLELLLNTVVKYQRNDKTSTDRSNDLIRKFKFLVKSNIKQHWNVMWYSDQLSISSKTLTRQVASHLNTTPKNYILNSLLAKLKKELLYSDQRIKEILAEYSYTETQLHRLFKKHVGGTMSAYRTNDTDEEK